MRVSLVVENIDPDGVLDDVVERLYYDNQKIFELGRYTNYPYTVYIKIEDE